MGLILENSKVNNILGEVTEKARDLYGEKLKAIVLYGSYARNEQDEESDIDIMLLIDVDEPELRYYDRKLSDIISDIGYRYMKVLSLIDISYGKFNNWVDTIPFYKNVQNEGVIVYEQ